MHCLFEVDGAKNGSGWEAEGTGIGVPPGWVGGCARGRAESSGRNGVGPESFLGKCAIKIPGGGRSDRGRRLSVAASCVSVVCDLDDGRAVDGGMACME